jgi:carboxyl-terminal processing protease
MLNFGDFDALIQDRVRDNAFHLSERFGRCQKFPNERLSNPFRHRRKMKSSFIPGPAAFFLTCAIAFAAGSQSILAATSDDEDNGYSQIAIFAKAVELIRQDYVDGNKTSYHELVTAALKGMLSSLDPHSQFMDPNDFRDMQDDTRSRFSGLGIEVAVKSGLPTVVTPMEDTPAARAGILSGDQILKINGASTDKMDLQDVINHLRGAPGQKITLTLIRPSTKEIKDYVLERTEIKVQSVKGAKLLDRELTGPFKIGYVRLIQFNEPTADELSKALDGLQNQGMQALILDLRNNPGGLLNSAVDVCAQFVPGNTKVVSTQGRVASQQRDYTTSTASKERPQFPMVVLVNEGSASGAEIVCGALKDLHRAIIVGETTFGKGSVQNVLPLPDGSAVRFTTAKYYTPSKQVIHGNGVTPNIRVPMTPEQERALLAQRSSDYGKPEDERNFIKSKDPQTLRAIDALKGVMIYAQQNATKSEAVKK